MLLQIGDTIVYPMHGAGVIAGVEKHEVLGEDKSYYVLQMPLGNMKVMIPTDNVENMGIRDVIDEEQLAEVKEILAETPEKTTGSWNKRYQAHLARMKSGDICDVAAVARNLVLQDRIKKISSGERRLLDLAKQILVSELVYACSKTPQEVETWMYDILDTNVAG